MVFIVFVNLKMCSNYNLILKMREKFTLDKLCLKFYYSGVGTRLVFMLKITIIIWKGMPYRAAIGYKKCACSKLLVILLAVKHAIDEINVHARFAPLQGMGVSPHRALYRQI